MFEAFRESIAIPLGMEDFRQADAYLQLEPSVSQHPAYEIPLSARDLARVGVLFLEEGRWGEQVILPAEWVRTSISPHTRFEVGG